MLPQSISRLERIVLRWHLVHKVLANERHLLHDVLAYTWDFAEEEESENTCYNAESCCSGTAGRRISK